MIGFLYESLVWRPKPVVARCRRQGVIPPVTTDYYDLVEIDRAHNLVPDEGVKHILTVAYKAGVQNLHWYLGLFEGNYVPQAGDTMALFPPTAVECVSYDETARPEWFPGTYIDATHEFNNAATLATFTMNNTTPKNIYGHFLASSPGKGAVTGVLGSVVRYPTPKLLGAGYVNQVKALVRLVST